MIIAVRYFFIKSFLIALLGFIFFNFHACKTVAPLSKDEIHYSLDEVYENILLNEPVVKTYNVNRIQIKITDNDEVLNLRGSIRIKRDSVALIGLNAFAGIEIARILLTSDSIKIIDRVNRNYFAGNYDDASRFFPVRINFDFFQSIFFGSTYKFLDESVISADSATGFIFEKDLLKMRFINTGFPDGNFKNNLIQLTIDRNFLTHNLEFYSSDNNSFGSLKFNSYSNIDNFFLPDDVNLYFVTHNIPFNAHFRFSRIEINRELNFPFNIPSSYVPLNK